MEIFRKACYNATIAEARTAQFKNERSISMSMLFSMSREKVLNKVIELSVDEISPNPHQPRRSFDESELILLSESIRQNGILQPLTVRKTGTGYELIAGERRLRSAKLAGLTKVPCIPIDVTERNSAVLALVENIQRQSLTFFDEAIAIDKLIDFYGMTQEDAAIRLGKAQSTIANKLRLLKFSEPEKKLIVSAGLTERHARALLKLPTEQLRAEAIDKIVRYNFNVERTEELVENLLAAEKAERSLKKRSRVFRDVRLFVNTINKAVETMKAAGISADAHKTQNSEYIEYVVRIPLTPETAR